MVVKNNKTKAAKGRNKTRMSSSMATAPVERKDMERERRHHMKELCAKLISLVPKQDRTSPASMDDATTYIKKLKDRVDELHQRRISVQAVATLRQGDDSHISVSAGMGSELEGEKVVKALAAPVVEVRHHDDSSMDVMLICSVDRPIKLHEVITILEEEGAEIVNANHSVAGQKIFYTIHFQAFSSRIGIDVSMVSKRLGALA